MEEHPATQADDTSFLKLQMALGSMQEPHYPANFAEYHFLQILANTENSIRHIRLTKSMYENAASFDAAHAAGNDHRQTPPTSANAAALAALQTQVERFSHRTISHPTLWQPEVHGPIFAQGNFKIIWGSPPCAEHSRVLTRRLCKLEKSDRTLALLILFAWSLCHYTIVPAYYCYYCYCDYSKLSLVLVAKSKNNSKCSTLFFGFQNASSSTGAYSSSKTDDILHLQIGLLFFFLFL